ncbi:autotransporter assembly complex family protein [Puniceibacterium sp. IMCC21224]|uniref:autotransporter assembly complex protein TamA n=1 Tax=Puniceibacterium sp. IMCC21224 TaxID=1618204 RepID=UPI00065D0D37|nr:BamA/TamA family outer membrane protein [Puniceibacterium sp. IMCC21224]KMK66178.1 autotransporter secretion outer membrane protein TamA [Puniceibacterium sp. IMCC21224]
MGMIGQYKSGVFGLVGMAFCAIVVPAPANAVDEVKIRVNRDDDEMRSVLKASSVVQSALDDGTTDAQDLFAAALSEYGNMLSTLYALGFYDGRVDVLVDGRQAADIPLLSVPKTIDNIEIIIDPGKPFRFGRAEIAPLSPDAVLPEDFATTRRARSGKVGEALDVAISSWRDKGFAKASIASQEITADHRKSILDVVIRVDRGPKLRFGKTGTTTESAVKSNTIRRIADIPQGERFDPEEVDKAAARLRRTGAFSSVAVTEADVPNPDDTLDIGISVVDEKPRRIGAGFEISSLDGVALTGFWMHRNIFGGAERLRFDAEIANIGSSTSGMDYSLTSRLSVPAIYGGDTDGYLLGEIAHEDEPTYISDRIELGFGVSRIYTNELSAETGLSFLYSETQDDLGDRTFTLLTLPTTVTLDERDNALDAKNGYYAKVELLPYIGLSGSASGARAKADLRAYKSFSEDDSQTIAARLQFGSVMGSDIDETLPEYLFTSGGGGTVRGQPYKSLDVDLGGGDSTGGRSFVGASLEYRTLLRGALGAVAFVDAGYIGSESFYDGTGEWHSGGGLGLRYNTGIGPIRFDVAAPISGSTSDGVQFYIGIGQSF